MAIKVQFPTGKSTTTVGGLFQWDYGQELEIECEEIGSELLEVHFACPSMTEAIVRACTFSNGVGTVEIPDECLEQTRAITAWLYRVNGTQGRTIKTITISITERTRPSKTRDIPTNFEDKYGQLIEEINEAVNALERGDITVAKARLADSAGHATTAGSATSATYATSAGASKLTWKSLNDLFGVEKFSQAESAGYTIELTDAQMTEYFPRGKVCILKRNSYWGEGAPVSDAQLFYISDNSGGMGMANPTLSITFVENSVTVYCYEDGALAPMEFEVDIAVLG